MAENGMQSQSILMQKEDSKHLIDFKKKNNFIEVHLIYKEWHKPSVCNTDNHITIGTINKQ